MARKLEEYKLFAIIAWLLVIGFASFVYLLYIHLSENAQGLANKTNYVEEVNENINALDQTKNP